MTPTGLLLPESLVGSVGFGIFVIFVGINTLVYLGLTVGRLVPWPRPVQPHRLAALRADFDPEEVIVTQPAIELRQLSDPAARLRLESAYQTIPIALTLSGVVAIVLTLILVFTAPQTSVVSDIAGAMFALAVLVVAQVAGRRAIPPTALPWLWSAGMAGVVGFVSWQSVEEDNPVTLAYALVILVALVPISMSWAAGLIGGGAALVGIVIAGYLIETVQTTGWALAALTALAVGAVLLQLRIISVNRIAAEQARLATLLTSDPLTGALSRRGLADLAPTVWLAAQLSGQRVYAVVASLDDLFDINDRYGVGYGDEVITATFRSLRATLPEGALIARWTAGAYAAVGVATIDESGLPTAMRRALDDSGVALGKRSVQLTLQIAEAEPATVTTDELIARASACPAIRA